LDRTIKRIKGSLNKICLKFSAFTRYFTFKVPASAQVLALACKTLWKFHVLMYTMHRFSHAQNCQSKMLNKMLRGHILGHVPCFKSVLHGEICGNFTWVGTFQSVGSVMQCILKVIYCVCICILNMQIGFKGFACWCQNLGRCRYFESENLVNCGNLIRKLWSNSLIFKKNWVPSNP